MLELMTGRDQVVPPVLTLETDGVEDRFLNLDVSELTYDDLVSILRDLGFHRKSSPDDPVPEEFQQGANPRAGTTTLQQLLDGTSKWSNLVKAKKEI
ncbi:selenoprotein M-like [Babylonia areolata]|uniref:selenoprotein M-like n=1 Tax=Babylonia areolata TaxID=304850 RepID=UPI003FD464CF